MLFTKGIISASFLGWCQKRLSCLLQTVKDLLANNMFCRSLFCQEMWKMKVRTQGETLWCYRPWDFIHGMWHLWIPENEWSSWPSKSMKVAFSTQLRFGVIWIIGNCHKRILTAPWWSSADFGVLSRSGAGTPSWLWGGTVPEPFMCLYSKCLWYPGSPLCLSGKGDKTKWGHRERNQIADNSLCCLEDGKPWFHLGVFCGDKWCCEWS